MAKALLPPSFIAFAGATAPALLAQIAVTESAVEERIEKPAAPVAANDAAPPEAAPGSWLARFGWRVA